MATAEDLLTAALRRSASNQTPALGGIEPELLAHLNRLYQRFYALFARARPDLATTTMDIELAGNPAMQIMAPVPIDVLLIYNEDEEQVHLIPATERHRTWHLAPCVYRNGAYIISRAHGGDPVACDILTLTITELPIELAALVTLVDPRFPVRHHQLLIDALAVYLSARDPKRDAAEHAKLVREYGQALATFAAEYELAPDAIEWAHEPVKRQKAVQS